MVITEIVLMKNSFKCSDYVKKKREISKEKRRGWGVIVWNDRVAS